jgi:hypothetical protein
MADYFSHLYCPFFTLPGEVEELTLNPGSNNIIVNWKKATVNSYCLMQYVIYWMNKVNGDNDSRRVSSEENSFVIEDLDACVQYEVSIGAVNERNESSGPVIGYTTTHTVGKY